MDALLNSTEFLAAIFGAVVGGVLTAGGGLLVYRRQAVREVRARIYEELIPRLPGGGEKPTDSSITERVRERVPVLKDGEIVGFTWADGSGFRGADERERS